MNESAHGSSSDCHRGILEGIAAPPNTGMTQTSVEHNGRMSKRGSDQHTRGWVVLVIALAVHVLDEALTNFLEFYNPLVLSIRARIPWFPMPMFTFDVRLAGLVLLVLILASLTPAMRRGGEAIWLASWVFGTIMFMNGLGHLAGSVWFRRWLPGATSAPLLLAASVFLMRATWQRRRSDAGRGRHVV